MKADFQNALGALTDLVKINSIETPPVDDMPFGKGNADALAYTLNLLENLGFHTTNLENYCGYGEVGEGELFGILGHLDVVPVGNGWTHPPFGAEIADGKLYGRGTMDDKGPMVACIFACARLLQEGFTPKKRIRFILGCDEESGWKCMERYAKTEEMPVAGFSPDADFPVINCEKGIVYHTLSFPLPKSVYTLSAGTRANVVPDYAEACLDYDEDVERIALARGCNCSKESGKLYLTAFGKSCHGSAPNKGINALIILLEALGAAYGEFNALYNAFCKFDGSGIGLKLYDKMSGSLTLNLGTAKAENGFAVFELDIRYPVSYKMGLITDILKSSLPLCDIDRGSFHLPLYVPKDDPLVCALLKAYNSVMKTDSKPISIGGGTYARFLPHGVAFGPQFPDTDATIHQKDEYIDLQDFQKMIDIYYTALKSLCF
ncbi:MAG: Sapep family Mn(2+)-dependent dipeptidase [Clostridia bacterium]|nr:Sapep family Mn(2+)-dependent dipeptidase [Clostridia bacterium]